MSEQPDSFPVLADAHRAKLQASAVSGIVAATRGYRSIYTKKDLRAAGFGQAQADVVTQDTPVLAIPLHDATGNVTGHQMRPDRPRAGASGKPLKYESPTRQAIQLDVPPMARAELGNPDVPLFVTEGPIKADAMVSRGMIAVALLGVWGWRGSNDDGAAVALSAFEAIALKNRPVYITFDSDVVHKPMVALAMRRLSTFLRSRGADVYIVQLPSADNGAKVGVDDWLAADQRRRVDDLRALAVLDVAAANDKKTLPSAPDEMGPLLDEVARFVQDFVIFTSDAEPVAVALWIAHSWCIDASDVTPRLNIASATYESGKSRLAEVLKVLCREPRLWINPSSSAVFRIIEHSTPTLIIDEVDNLMTRRDADPDLRSVVNEGYRRGASVPRSERGPDGAWHVEEHKVFSAMALVGIGTLPSVTASRAIVVKLRRRVPGRDRAPKDFLLAKADEAAEPVRELLEAWAGENTEALRHAEPLLEQRLMIISDRFREVWRPLLAIADAAGEPWAGKARAALEELWKGRQQTLNEYAPILLVNDLHVLFHSVNDATGLPEDTPYLTSQAIVDQLRKNERWADYGRGEFGITKTAVARMLADFEIQPGEVGPANARKRGYQHAHFADVWMRYTQVDPASSCPRCPYRPAPANTGPAGVDTSVDTSQPSTQVSTLSAPENGALDGLDTFGHPVPPSRVNGVHPDPAMARRRPGFRGPGAEL